MTFKTFNFTEAKESYQLNYLMNLTYVDAFSNIILEPVINSKKDLPVIFEYILKAEEITFDAENICNLLKADKGDYDQILEWLKTNRLRSRTKRLNIIMEPVYTYELTEAEDD